MDLPDTDLDDKQSIKTVIWHVQGRTTRDSKEVTSLVKVSNKRINFNYNGLTYRTKIVIIRETTLGIGYLRRNPYHLYTFLRASSIASDYIYLCIFLFSVCYYLLCFS